VREFGDSYVVFCTRHCFTNYGEVDFNFDDSMTTFSQVEEELISLVPKLEIPVAGWHRDDQLGIIRTIADRDRSCIEDWHDESRCA